MHKYIHEWMGLPCLHFIRRIISGSGKRTNFIYIAVAPIWLGICVVNTFNVLQDSSSVAPSSFRFQLACCKKRNGDGANCYSMFAKCFATLVSAQKLPLQECRTLCTCCSCRRQNGGYPSKGS